MVQVQGYSEEDLDVLEEELASIIVRSLSRAVSRAADQLHPAITAASSASIGPDDVSVVSTYWLEEVNGEILPYVGQVYTGSAVSVAVGLADGFPLDASPGVPLLPDEWVMTFLNTVTADFVSVGDDVWEDVREVVVQGVKRGESIEQIAAKMRHVTDFTQNRATEVARTVVHSASESGGIAQLRFVGYDSDTATKMWLSSHDARVRPTHARADKQVVPLGERFTVGLTTLDFPGDPTGASNEIRQCRCTTIFEIDETPKLRCVAALTASTTATKCVSPTPSIDISHVPASDVKDIFNAMQTEGITPAYGGAAIFKALASVRKKMLTVGLDTSHYDDLTMLAIIDSKWTSKGAHTFTSKFLQWAQSSAGKKALPNLVIPGEQHVVAPIASPASSVTSLPKLPPVKPKPKPTDLTYTGTTLGTHGARVYVDMNGDRWLFKPQPQYATDLDIATSRIQSAALETRPGVYRITLDGQDGSIQYMFDSKEAFPKGSFDPLKLTPDEILTLQQGQIFDWLVSNFDTHSGQWIRLVDGKLFGTDKGQAFKFFGQDKLDWDYVPVTPLGSDKLTYQSMWRAYVDGKDIDLQDPTQGPLGVYIDQLMAIPDDEYRKLLAAYAQAKGKPTPEAFLDAAIKRKNSLKKDFAAFWARAQMERAKHTPKPKPDVIESAPLSSQPIDIVTYAANEGNIDWIADPIKDSIWDDWVVFIGGGKKVTPAWGGSKIWKQLESLRALVNVSGGIAMPDGSKRLVTHLELLRVLDQQGGFANKDKTFESVVKEWLTSPAGKKAVPNPPTSLVTSTVQQVVKPSIVKSVIDIDEVKATGAPTTIPEIYLDLHKYKDGDVIAYGFKVDETYRIVRVGPDVFGVQRLQSSGTWTVPTHWGQSQLSELIGIHWDTKWKIATPSVTKLPSKIPGKAPGDVVTATEIDASKMLWKAGDVVATAEPDPTGGYMTIIAKGDGGFDITYTSQTGTSFITKTIKPHTKFPASVYGNNTWKLSGSSVTPSVPSPKTKPSIITGLNAGDVANFSDIQKMANLQDSMPVAYAYDAVAQVEYRVKTESGFFTFEMRSAGDKHWTYVASTADPQSTWTQIIDMWNKYTWFAAGKNGETPDVFKIIVPTQKTPDGVKSAATLIGKYEGDEVSISEIWDSSQASYKPGTIIAVSDVENSARFRVVVNDTGKLNLEVEIKDGGWGLVLTMVSKTDIPTVKVWRAVAGPPTTPKKIVHVNFPDKSAGDTLTIGEITKTMSFWEEGDIVALGKKKLSAHEYRLVKVKDGYLVEVKPEGVSSWLVAPSQSIDTYDWVVPPKILKVPSKQKTVLTGNATHIPGVSVGDTVASKDIWLSWESYVDGQLIAVRSYYGKEQRLFVAGGKLVIQTKTKTGAWAGTKIVSTVWDIPSTGWKAANDHISPIHLKNAQKFVAKKTTPASQTPGAAGGSTTTPIQFEPAIPTGYTPLPPIPEAARFLRPITKAAQVKRSDLVPPSLDLSGYGDVEKSAIVEAFRLTHLKSTSSPEAIFKAIEKIVSDHQAKGAKYKSLTVAHVLRFIDEARDKRLGLTEPSFTYEKAVVTWWVKHQNQVRDSSRPQVYDAPVFVDNLPPVIHRLDAPGQLDPDKQKYRQMTVEQAKAMQRDMEAKYGVVTPEERAGVIDYTGGHFREINHAVRDGTIESSVYRDHMKNLVRAMRPSTAPIRLLRATGWSDFFDESIKSYDDLVPYVGRVFAWRRMVSTTTETRRTYSVLSDVVFHIEAPTGSPMVYAQAFPGSPGEKEMILAPHTMFRITKVEKRGTSTHVTVRLVGVLQGRGT